MVNKRSFPSSVCENAMGGYKDQISSTHRLYFSLQVVWKLEQAPRPFRR